MSVGLDEEADVEEGGRFGLEDELAEVEEAAVVEGVGEEREGELTGESEATEKSGLGEGSMEKGWLHEHVVGVSSSMLH